MMSDQELKAFLVQWLNKNAAVTARKIPFQSHDDTTLVMAAFNLDELTTAILKALAGKAL